MENNENYTCLTVKSSARGQNNGALESLAYGLGCLGIEELNLQGDDLDKVPGLDRLCGQGLEDGEVRSIENFYRDQNIQKFYFTGKETQEVDHFLTEIKKQELGEVIDVFAGANENWNESWKQYYEKLEIPGGIQILPVWEKNNDKGIEGNKVLKTEIIINPAMAFGTGTHETTQLCLTCYKQHFEKANFRHILDFGCGSGILGILAQLLNQELSVDYYDIDEQALKNTEENLQLNKIAKDYRLFSKPEFSQGYDFVFANVLLDILLEEKSTLLSKMVSKGFLLVSGLLNEQVDEFLSSYKTDFNLIDQVSKNEWSAILLKKIK